PHPRHRYVSAPAHRLVVDAPDSKSVSLKAREVSVGVGACSAESFGEISDQGRVPRLVACFTLIIAVVLQLKRVMTVHCPAARHLISRLKHQRLIFAMGDVRVL